MPSSGVYILLENICKNCLKNVKRCHMSLFVLRFFIIKCKPSVKLINNSSSHSTDIIVNPRKREPYRHIYTFYNGDES